MKKNQKAQAAFLKIKRNLPQLIQGSASSKARNLWHNEAVIRSQIRRLQELPARAIGEYDAVWNQYVALLDDVSGRLLEQYNHKHCTQYQFSQVRDGNFEAYLKSGIVSVLVTSHIPQMVTSEFRRLLPTHPEQEYPQAREKRRKFYLHLGETNTGKTYQALQRLKQSQNGVYLAPLRLLALENFERMQREGVPCSLLTGEEEVTVEGATHLCCTVEKASLATEYEVAVLDEVQMVADSQRGDAWTRAILGLRCPEIHLCGASLAKPQLLAMIADCGDEYELMQYTRLVPLQVEHGPVQLSKVQKGDALVAFSKRNVLAFSRCLSDLGIDNSVIYGDLPPEVRRMQYESFIRGDHPVLVSTDAIGMGVNLPIRRIVFTEAEKFDGESRRLLTSQEVKQIAGRAGRIGIYEVGYVAGIGSDIYTIEERLGAEDEPIEQAVIGPSEAILQINLLPLREKLALWSNEPETLPYYRKKDVRNELLVLELLQPYRLPESVQWKLMRVPFDPGNEALMEQFDEYTNACFVRHAQWLEKPPSDCSTCGEYETYYQQVNLYYSFSKTMGLPLDEAWVSRQRRQVSEKIQNLLTTQAAGSAVSPKKLYQRRK